MPENTQPQGQTGGQPIGGQPQPAQVPTPAPMPVAPMLPVQPAPAPVVQPTPAPIQAPVQPAPVQPAPAAIQPIAPVQPAPAPAPVQPVAPVVQPTQPATIPIMYAIPAQPVVQQAPPQPARPAMAPQVGQVARPVQGAPLRPGQPLKPGLATRKPPNPKKLIYGCTGCFGAALLFFIIFVLIFAAQTTAAGDNPMARSLGVDTGTFINTLNTIVNMVFVGLEVLLFLLVIVGLFRFFMARKDDKDAKKRGLSLAGVTFLLLLFFGGIWIGIILFMDTKKVRVQSTKVSIGIVTEPVVTLGLTAPITIKFDGSKLPIDARTYDILSYLWSFGDGGTSTVATTSHTYKDKGSNNGRYDVTLQVIKRSKAKLEETTDTFTATVTIANVELGAVIAATPETGPAPLEVSFDAGGSSAPAGEIVAYEWDFNNDNNFTDASGVTVTHTFEQLGTYTVNLRVTDNTNQFAVVSKEITVESPNIPTSVIEIPSESGEYFVGTKYRFLGDKSTSPNGEIQKYEWDFGDGSAKANTRQADHIYKSAGTYDVILKTTDGEGETGEATKQLKLQIKESAPIAVMNTVPPPAKEEDGFIAGTIPFEVSFDAGKSTDPDNNIVDYKWDFDGDGKEDAAGAKGSFVYKNEGSFNASLTVIDAENNESAATLVIKVLAQPLQARLVAIPVEGVIPLIVTFDASSSTYQNGQIVSYEWDFGDGSPKRIDVSKVTYKYMKIGTFTAKVTAIASDNSKSTAETPVNVRPVALTSCFTPSTESGPAPLTVEFDTKCSTGTVAKTSWDFGDGETSKTRKPTHTFKTPGSYEVTLEVADNQNVLDTFSKSILVTGTL